MNIYFQAWSFLTSTRDKRPTSLPPGVSPACPKDGSGSLLSLKISKSGRGKENVAPSCPSIPLRDNFKAAGLTPLQTGEAVAPLGRHGQVGSSHQSAPYFEGNGDFGGNRGEKPNGSAPQFQSPIASTSGAHSLTERGKSMAGGKGSHFESGTAMRPSAVSSISSTPPRSSQHTNAYAVNEAASGQPTAPADFTFMDDDAFYDVRPSQTQHPSSHCFMVSFQVNIVQIIQMSCVGCVGMTMVWTCVCVCVCAHRTLTSTCLWLSMNSKKSLPRSIRHKVQSPAQLRCLSSLTRQHLPPSRCARMVSR